MVIKGDIMSEQLQYAAEEFHRVLKETLTPSHLGDTTIAEFIAQYLACNNVNRAAKACNLSSRDGKWLFNQPDIYKAITTLQTKDVEKFGYQAAEIVENTKNIANLDPADLFDDDGRIYENIHDVPAHARGAIKSIVVKNIFENDHNGMPQYKGKLVKVEFWDKLKANELLGREKDTFKKTEVVQHDISKNARQYLLGSINRANEAKQLLNAPVKDVTPIIEVESKPVFSKPKGVK